MVYNQPPVMTYPPYSTGVMQPLPYQDRMAQLQQYNQNLQQQFQPVQQPAQNMVQPQPQLSGISGKFIQVPENINANDVPMDGSVAFFPLQDMSQIICKAWNANGSINTVVYKPVEQPSAGQTGNAPSEVQNAQFEAFNSVLEGISGKIDSVSSRLDEFIGKSRAKKKEVEVNE